MFPIHVSPSGLAFTPLDFTIAEQFRRQRVSLKKEPPMTIHTFATARMAQPVLPTRSLAEVTEAVKAAAGTSIHRVPALIACLKGAIGNPDLEGVMDAIERIYDAAPEAHHAAAAELDKAATDICDEHEI